jgi:hypothetical protein
MGCITPPPTHTYNAAESAKDFVETISSLECLNSIVESNPGKLLYSTVR